MLVQLAQTQRPGCRLRSDQNPGQRACGASLLSGGAESQGHPPSHIRVHLSCNYWNWKERLTIRGSGKRLALRRCSSDVPSVAAGPSAQGLSVPTKRITKKNWNGTEMATYLGSKAGSRPGQTEAKEEVVTRYSTEKQVESSTWLLVPAAACWGAG